MSVSTSGRREQAAEIADRERHGRRGQEAEAVVVGGEAERARHFAREAVAQERREPDVREPALRTGRRRGRGLRACRCARPAIRSPPAGPTSGAAARATAARAPSRASRTRRASRAPISRRVAAASCVESAILPPVQRGTCGAFAFAGVTHAVSSRTRTSSSTRPANTNASPGTSRAIKPSSTWPSAWPLRRRTVMLASETIVPMPIRCRRAIAASGTRAMPSSPITTRRYSG